MFSGSRRNCKPRTDISVSSLPFVLANLKAAWDLDLDPLDSLLDTSTMDLGHFQIWVAA